VNQINIQYHKTKYGEFILGSFEDKLCLLDFRYRKLRAVVDKRLQEGFDAIFVEQSSDVIQDSIKQLDEYFNMQRREFDVPIITTGSDFQKKVWKALQEVPYAKTSTYLDIAIKIGNKKATKAVASANAANSIGIIIPCHRIIGSNGELIGYGGGLAIKKRLLKLEQNLFCAFR